MRSDMMFSCSGNLVTMACGQPNAPMPPKATAKQMVHLAESLARGSRAR
jgi:hypothetical protein